MTIGERKECDERETAMWNRGFTVGIWTAGIVAGLLSALIYEVFLK
jgi:hypothetical protein